MDTIEQLCQDLTSVVNHVLRDEEYQYGMRAACDINAQLAVRVAVAKFKNRPELATVVSWVKTAMMWTARARELSHDEIRVHAATQRVEEALTMFATIDQLGQAIAAQNWQRVRRCWWELTPYHGFILGLCPEAEVINVALHNRRGLAKRAPAVH